MEKIVYSKEQARELYEKMATIRYFESCIKHDSLA